MMEVRVSDNGPVGRTLAGLREMAARAAWGEVLELSQDLLMRAEEADMAENSIGGAQVEVSGVVSMVDSSGGLADDPDTALARSERKETRVQCGIYRIMGFLQTRRYIRAGQELDDQTKVVSGLLGTSHDGSESSEQGPFALRALSLEVAARRGDATVVDQAYRLRRDTLDGRFDREADCDDETQTLIWRQGRVLYVLSLTVGYCLRLQRQDGALDALREMLELTEGKDPLVLFALVRVLLHLGDLESAEEAFERARQYCADDEAMMRLHKGLLFAAGGGQTELRSAVGEFTAVLQLQPDNMVAINNLAICKLHLGDLPAALEQLEFALRDAPEMALDEGLVFNLCTLYDLSCPDDANSKKQSLHRLAAKHGRQGFNMDSVTLQRNG